MVTYSEWHDGLTYSVDVNNIKERWQGRLVSGPTASKPTVTQWSETIATSTNTPFSTITEPLWSAGLLDTSTTRRVRSQWGYKTYGVHLAGPSSNLYSSYYGIPWPEVEYPPTENDVETWGIEWEDEFPSIDTFSIDVTVANDGSSDVYPTTGYNLQLSSYATGEVTFNSSRAINFAPRKTTPNLMNLPAGSMVPSYTENIDLSNYIYSDNAGDFVAFQVYMLPNNFPQPTAAQIAGNYTTPQWLRRCVIPTITPQMTLRTPRYRFLSGSIYDEFQWWAGNSLLGTEFLGWWTGNSIERAKIEGWWTGGSIQPVQNFPD